MSTADNFVEQRLAATRDFAHTMIVVDDEAWNSQKLGGVPRAGLRPPRRGRRVSDPTQQEMFLIRHSLDTEKLVDAAMSLGLVCSIIRPPKGRSIKSQVGLAARRADIICLDWELHNDGGESATKIIAEIVRSDEKQDGRLRLIAIYTGDTNNNQILEKVFDTLPKAYRKRFAVNRDAVRIASNNGLRIICLFKAHGVQLADSRKERQVKESDLPDRLQKEFAMLAGGLLSNVALATIASIRNSTHHVLARMTESMDAPYFHHRAIIPTVADAEEYSVDVILSDLKSSVDKHEVAQKYAGPKAIAARITEMAQGSGAFNLRYESGGVARNFSVSLKDTIRLITRGNTAAYGKIAGGNKPGFKTFHRGMSTLFAKDQTTARSAMFQFAVLTGIRAHPGSHLYKTGARVPQLGLGTIIQKTKTLYYLCLQASCDSVRIKKRAAFLFVPLKRKDNNPDHVVPVLGRGGMARYVGLSIPRTVYTQSLSIQFDPDDHSQTVRAKKIKRRGIFFTDVDGAEYRWIADLKQRRALRTAQELGQSLGRLGFDEFEPLRKGAD